MGDRPSGTLIRRRMQEILKKEGRSMEDGTLSVLVESSGNDLRQVLNTLQLQSGAMLGLSLEESKKV